MKPADRQEFFRRLQSVMPEPTTELDYKTPFELLIAVILSAQATDVSVNKATRKLYSVANTPGQIFGLGVEGLKPFKDHWPVQHQSGKYHQYLLHPGCRTRG